jgi:RNA polymerase sigma-70 factor (ECF subfamily)
MIVAAVDDRVAAGRLAERPCKLFAAKAFGWLNERGRFVDQAGLDELFARAGRRDPDALLGLVEAYSPRVFGLLYRLTGSRDTAEELLQETFLRLVRNIDRYVHDGKFESWLFRIAANLARDHGRRSGRRGRTASLDDPGRNGDLRANGRLVVPEADPGARLLEKEAGERLAACIASLSDIEREIILLRHYSELSFREIADLLGVPLGTALARAHRALGRLKAALGGESER